MSAGDLDFRGTERFEIRRSLGTGAFGAVYEALDRERNTVVALKRLHQATAEGLYRFKREFRSLADLHHHNLVCLYELLADGENWSFTMELVRGMSFLDFVREPAAPERVAPEREAQADDLLETVARGGPPRAQLACDLHRLRTTSSQLAEGLGFLHRNRKLHRDLKSSNALVTREGRVVILDFGLVSDQDASGLLRTMDAQIIGTPAYMAPEQAAGRPATEASDWYAVGVLLYEALTGQLPFTGSLVEVLTKKQTLVPPEPAALVAGVPEELNRLCVDLLQPAPERRPTADDVLTRLSGFSGSPVRLEKLFTVEPTFIGRESELAAFDEAFAAAGQGKTIVRFVEGGAGTGKTALVHRFLEILRERESRAVVLAGRCLDQESVPYKALDGVVDSLSAYLLRLSPSQLPAVIARHFSALAKLFPVLNRVPVSASARGGIAEGADPQELRLQAFRAFSFLLGRIAELAPLVVFIDDLQWGDSDSAELLAEVLSAPEPPSFLLLGAYRGEDRPASAPLAKLMGEIEGKVDFRIVRLEELRPEQARELARTLLSEGGPARLDSVDAIVREAGGNPLFIGELVRYSLAGGLPGREGPETPFPEVIGARLARLPHNAQRLLETLAVAGRPLPRKTARRAAELEDDEPGVFAALRSAHLVRTGVGGADTVEIYHQRIRETILFRLSLPEQQALHQRLARALEAAGEPEPEVLARHYHGAGAAEEGAHYAVLAAHKASDALAFDRAAEFYTLALELGRFERSDENRLRVKLGEALANAGRGQEAARAFLSAVDDAEPLSALELRQKAAEQLLRSGRVDEGVAVLRTVLDRVRLRWPRTPTEALVCFLWRRFILRLRGLRFRERPAAEIEIPELLRIDTCHSVAVGLALVDTIRAADFQTRHLLLALRAGEPLRVAQALTVEIGYTALGGTRTARRTERILQLAWSLAERLQQPIVLGRARLAAGLAAGVQGRFRRAHELYEQAAEIFRNQCTGAVWELFNSQLYSLATLFFLGELKKVSRRQPELMRDARARSDLWAETMLRLGNGMFSHGIRLAADDPEGARQEIRTAIASWSHRGFLLQHFFELLALAEIDLYCGEGMAAWTRVRERWPALKRSLLLGIQELLIHALALRARSGVAAAALDSGERRLLLSSAERDARRIEREGAVWGNGLSFAVRAGVAWKRQKREEAHSFLIAAENAFETAEMGLHAAVARRRRGELLGGEPGELLLRAADRWLADQGVRNPERYAAMILPGNWRRLNS